MIRYNCQEKIGILPYIIKNLKGTYLEIGTGGDPISEIFDKIPSCADISIIASDIDGDVLAFLPQRHPKLLKYIHATSGPSLSLQTLNAVDMGAFDDNFFDGINVSSVVHEIFSYEQGYSGIRQFFKEAFRTLKIGGMLVYRDPEGLPDRQSIVSLRLKNVLARSFSHIFIYKFLDTRGSCLGQAGRKVQMYKPEDILFTIYKRNESSPTNLTYKQYLEVPSYDIDFSRNYEIRLPLGLYRELARHYLTYLHQCNPLAFIKFTPDIYSDYYKIAYFAHSTVDILNNFLNKYNWKVVDEKVSNEQKNIIEKTIYANAKVLEFGIPLQFKSKIKENQLHNLLKKYGFSPGTHMINLHNGTFLLDYRVFGMLYDEISRLFDLFNGVADLNDEVHARWLKREGEEFYIYYSDDELISTVAKTTITTIEDENGEKELLVLCPLNEECNKFIHRICYTEMLNDSIELKDSLGYQIEVNDGKRVVHFCKMRLKSALEIFEKIIQSDVTKYPLLRLTVDNIKEKYQL